MSFVTCVTIIYHLVSEFLCQVDEHCKGKGICIKAINECDCNPGWSSADCTGMYGYIIQGPLKISLKMAAFSTQQISSVPKMNTAMVMVIVRMESATVILDGHLKTVQVHQTFY